VKFMTGANAFGALLLAGLVLVPVTCIAGHGLPTDVDMTRPGIRFNVERVRYTGDDTYEVELAFENETRWPIGMNSFVNDFSVQSEVIGQWIPLSVKKANGPGSNEQAHVRVLLVRIPENLPGLYRNMDGEMNLRIVSRLHETTENPGRELLMDAVRHYWVPPGSGEWILREGM